MSTSIKDQKTKLAALTAATYATHVIEIVANEQAAALTAAMNYFEPFFWAIAQGEQPFPTTDPNNIIHIFLYAVTTQEDAQDIQAVIDDIKAEWLDVGNYSMGQTPIADVTSMPPEVIFFSPDQQKLKIEFLVYW